MAKKDNKPTPKIPSKKKNTAPKPRKDTGKVGRPSKLTKQVIKDFTDAISQGAGYVLASHWAKISVQVSSLWMREGRKEQERRDMGEKPDKSKDGYLEFLMAVREAEAEVGIVWQQTLNRAASSDPQWAWKMAHARFSADYATIAEQEEIEIPSDMSIEYLQRIISGESPLTVVQDWKKHQLLIAELNKNVTKPDTQTT